MTPALDHERLCAEIIEQTRQFVLAIEGADLDAQVPSCPDWTVRQLAVHLGDAHRWANEIVRLRAREEIAEEAVPATGGPGTDAPDALGAWLTEGAWLLADGLREAGPHEPVWTWASRQEAGFWARRMTHETAVHRADACLATGVAYTVAPQVAADCVDEWLEIIASPQTWEYDEELRRLRDHAGRSLHLHATDASPDVAAEWLIELTVDGIVWRRDHARADVALRGPLTEVLLAFYRRRPPGGGRTEVLGDAALLDFWLARTGFGG